EAELAHGAVQQIPELQRFRQLVQPPAEIRLAYPVHLAEQAERFDDADVPPQLAALAEDDADAADEGFAVAPGHIARHFHPPGRRDQNAGQHLDGGRFARSVFPDVAADFPFRNPETDVPDRDDFLVPPQEQVHQRAPQAFAVFGHPERFAQALDFDGRHVVLRIPFFFLYAFILQFTMERDKKSGMRRRPGGRSETNGGRENRGPPEQTGLERRKTKKPATACQARHTKAAHTVRLPATASFGGTNVEPDHQTRRIRKAVPGSAAAHRRRREQPVPLLQGGGWRRPRVHAA